MGWSLKTNRPLSELVQMPMSERIKLTDRECADFVPQDTMFLAGWMGALDAAKKQGKVPYRALEVALGQMLTDAEKAREQQ